ncbi:histidine kinase [Actinomadura madurae]|uniref:histidine kinase n=1 Tax=Actinomadura madurae TaxID=1993 RepID=UPI000D83DDBB|nr:histidine kinase [Actinomadura madurae]SPT57709.1 sensory histidine kinase UhpB [Actinomadura madurae]
MGLLPAPATRFVRAWGLDVGVLLAVAGITWAPPFPDGPAEWGPLAGTAAMLAAGTVIIAGRRIGAEPAAAAAAVAGVTGWALAASGRFATADELTNLLMSLAPVLLTYGGHLYARDRRRAWTAVALLTVAAAHPWSTSMQAAADGLLYICAPMLFGFYRQTQRMLVRTLTDRARDAERERDLCAEQARAQERTRMAVELHDVVTHRVSLMVLHAGALRITTADAAVRDAAENVRAIGCEALAELRELIGVLRGSRSAAPAPVAGPPGDPVVAGTGPSAAPPRIDRSDLCFAAAAGVWTLLLSTLVATAPPVGSGEPALPWLEIGLQLPLAAALVLRRRHPHAAAVPTLAGTVVLLGLAVTGSAGLLATGDSTRLLVPAVAPLVAYTVAAHSRRPVLGTAVVLALLALAARPWDPYAVVVSVAAVFIGLPALLGLYVGVWRRLVVALTERAERARRERRLLTERARAGERARLTREMHAIVSGRVHDMLDWADRLGGAAPSAESAQASAELAAAGRQALDELHDLAGAFQTGDGAPGAAGGPVDLAGLAAQSASVGVPVELVETGDPATPSPAIARTARRIVGEALTNVRKHAYGAQVRVEVRYDPEQVRVRVSNGRPPAGPFRGDRDLAAVGSGTGLLGVRQRVDLVDGTLVAGPTGDGGFVLDAILPACVPTTSHAASTRTAEEPAHEP